MSKRFGSKSGFTLAEVLITLGIIGVVAAMTIPTLIANTNSSKFSSQYKKTLSSLNQAALMATAHHDSDFGTLSDSCKGQKGAEAKTDSLNDGQNSICGLFNATLSGATYNPVITALKANNKAYSLVEIGGADKTNVTLSADNAVGYTLADGSLIVVPYNLKECTHESAVTRTVLITQRSNTAAGLKGCIGYIDVNGPTLPNKEVICANDTATSKTNTKLEPEKICSVPKDTAHMNDVYPVVFHDQTVEPATNAAKGVLTGATANAQ